MRLAMCRNGANCSLTLASSIRTVQLRLSRNMLTGSLPSEIGLASTLSESIQWVFTFTCYIFTPFLILRSSLLLAEKLSSFLLTP